MASPLKLRRHSINNSSVTSNANFESFVLIMSAHSNTIFVQFIQKYGYTRGKATENSTERLVFSPLYILALVRSSMK